MPLVFMHIQCIIINYIRGQVVRYQVDRFSLKLSGNKNIIPCGVLAALTPGEQKMGSLRPICSTIICTVYVVV
jgi:hypothetical protein